MIIELSNTDIPTLKNCFNSYNLHEELCLLTQYSYIGITQSYIDVMQDHLEMAYWMEELAKNSKILEYNIHKGKSVFPEITIKLLPHEERVNKIFEIIERYIIWGNSLFEQDTDQIDYIETFDDFKSNLEKYTFKFPDEIDNYYINLIDRGIFEIAAEEEDPESYLTELYQSHPEWKYGLCNHHFLEIKENTLFLSSVCTMISKELDFKMVLAQYFNISMTSKYVDCTKYNGYFISEYGVFSESELKNFTQLKEYIDTYWPNDEVADKSTVFLSTNAEIIYTSYKGFYIIYYYPKLLSKQVAESIFTPVKTLHDRLKTYIYGNEIVKPIQWDNINPGMFEDLCFDLLCTSSKFDRNLIHKMGKPNSRDGGRDIYGYLRHRYNEIAKKIIVQCKFSSRNSTISTKNLNSVSDVICQYDADIYLLMTNCRIDSTLIDRFEALGKTLARELIIVSEEQLSHCLIMNNDIMEKYHL